MYGLVFYFFYRYFLYRDDSSPRFGAICGTFLTIGFHVLLVYTIVQEIAGHKLLNPLSETYYRSKILNMLIVFPFLFLAIIFFNKKRIDRIIERYDDRVETFNFINWFIFIFITVVPLALIIFLLRK